MANSIEGMRNFLSHNLEVSGLVEITLGRLRYNEPDGDWTFTGDHCLHQGELFLHFAEGTHRRMWWVRVDEDGPELAMSWNMEGMSDLV